jgi:UDP-N-acetylglucosamine 4,6-dehydratase
MGDRYIVTPVVAEWGYKEPEGQRMPEGMAYQSNTNSMWMTKKDIEEFLNSGN